MFLANLFLRARGYLGELPTGSWGQKFRERQTERESEERVAACVDESKWKGMKDTRDGGENGVSHGAEQLQMQRIAVGYFPFTPIAFS